MKVIAERKRMPLNKNHIRHYMDQLFYIYNGPILLILFESYVEHSLLNILFIHWNDPKNF